MGQRRDELRDAALRVDIRDVLAHDRRLEALDLEVDVRRGAAHVSGAVGSSEERELIRSVIARVRGVQAVWDTIEVEGRGPLRIVDIGCGPNKQFPSSIGIDQFEHPAVDIVANLEGGLPIADRSIDHLFAVHVLEHIRDLVPLMNDIHRVLRSDGVLHILAPHWRHVNAVADPTHVRFISPETFEYFCIPRPGMCLYRPLAVSATNDTVFADLQPADDGGRPASSEALALVFDC